MMKLKKRWIDQRAQSMVEYIFIILLVVLVLIGGFRTIGEGRQTTLDTIASNLSSS